MELRKEVAKGLLSIEAVFLRPEEPFTWASGIKSPIYCDNRLTLTAPEVRTLVEQGLMEVVKENYPEAEVLMGTSTAGIAHAAIAGHILSMPMGYVRSGSKDHGRQKPGEDHFSYRCQLSLPFLGGCLSFGTSGRNPGFAGNSFRCGRRYGFTPWYYSGQIHSG